MRTTDSPPNSANRMTIRAQFAHKQIDAPTKHVQLKENYEKNHSYAFALDHLTFLGLALILAGIICYTAFNWVFLSPIIRFSAIELLLVAALTYAFYTAKTSIGHSCALIVASVLIGCFWATFGQIYQINTAPYFFPLTWLVCLVPLAVIGRTVFPTLLSFLLLYATLVMHAAETHFYGLFPQGAALYEALALFNFFIALLIIWSYEGLVQLRLQAYTAFATTLFHIPLVVYAFVLALRYTFHLGIDRYFLLCPLLLLISYGLFLKHKRSLDSTLGAIALMISMLALLLRPVLDLKLPISVNALIVGITAIVFLYATTRLVTFSLNHTTHKRAANL